MIRAAIAEARVFDSWLDYQNALVRAITPLSEGELQHRPLAGRRSAGEIAEHIVFGRALHLHRILGAQAGHLTPYHSWERPAASPRSAAEVVEGLQVTWKVIATHVMAGSATDDIPRDDDGNALQTIWGLLDHDLPHAGQLSILLRAAGLPGVDI
jgi:uncharacterized damage-inducible protein DinB